MSAISRALKIFTGCNSHRHVSRQSSRPCFAQRRHSPLGTRHFQIEPLEERTLLSFSATIDQYPATQVDPTNNAEVHFKAVFGTGIDVTSFNASDIVLTGTASASVIAITNTNVGTDTIFDIKVRATTDGTVIANIPADKVLDAAKDQMNAAATFTDNMVTYEAENPTVTVALAAGQAASTSTSPIKFDVTFSEAVTDFNMSNTGGIRFIGTAAGAKVTAISQVAGTNTYTVSVGNMTSDGSVQIEILAGRYHDGMGKPSTASPPSPAVTYNLLAGQIVLGTGQAATTGKGPIHFTVQFNKPVVDLTASDIDLSLSTDPGPLSVVVTNEDYNSTTKTYNYDLAVIGMSGTTPNNVRLRIPAGAVYADTGNGVNQLLTSPNVVWNTRDAVTVEQWKDQLDPVSSNPLVPDSTLVQFLVTFGSDMAPTTAQELQQSLSISSNGTLSVTGLTQTVKQIDARTYMVTITGFASGKKGELIATLAANKVKSADGNWNIASTSVDNKVTVDTTNLTCTITVPSGQDSPATTAPVNFTITFSRPVVDFNASKLTVKTTAGSAFFSSSETVYPRVTVTGIGNGENYGKIFNVAVDGMICDGVVQIGTNLNVIHDAFGNALTTAATLSQNSVSLNGSFDTVGLYNAATSSFVLKANIEGGAGTTDMDFDFGPPNGSWKPIAGDWDHDGIDTIGLYDPITSRFHLRNSNATGLADITFAYGPAGYNWTPIAGDWNGDGIDTIGLYDPHKAMFYLRDTNTSGVADVTLAYGPANIGWKPIAGDWNGDGKDTIGLYRPATSTFYLRNTNDSGIADLTFGYGPASRGWIPIASDWNGDGKDTVGLYDAKVSRFYLRNTNDAGIADRTFAYAPADSGRIPVIGNWHVSAPSSSLLASDGEVAATSETVSLAQSALQPLVSEAIARWAAAGLPASSLAALGNIRLVVADLAGSCLGRAEGDTIFIDQNAAGHGWFIDSTPTLDEEFTPSGTQAIDPRAVDRIDLLTVVEHELGHIAGLDDLDALADDLMSGTLGVGVRREPENCKVILGS